MDEVVFSAQVGPWVCIKKQKVEPDTKKIEIARMLASIHDSMDKKVWHFLGEDFRLEELDKIAYEITGAQFDEKKKEWVVRGRTTEQQIAEALAKLNSPATTRQMNVGSARGKEIAKSYLTRKVLDLLGFRLELDPKAVDKYLGEKAKSSP
jgi:hypothetical protein